MDGNRASGSEDPRRIKASLKTGAQYTISGRDIHDPASPIYFWMENVCVHESETIQNRAFDRTFVGVSMLVNNEQKVGTGAVALAQFQFKVNARMKVVPRWFPDLRQIVPRFATKEFLSHSHRL